MKIVKLALISFVVFALMVTGFSLLMPSTVVVNESVQVAADREQIISRLNDLQAWRSWHPGLKDATVSADGKMLQWQNNKLTLTESDSSHIRFTIESPGRKPIDNYITISQLSNTPQLNVEWRSIHSIKWYPWEKFGAIALSQTQRPALKASLEGLQKALK